MVCQLQMIPNNKIDSPIEENPLDLVHKFPLDKLNPPPEKGTEKLCHALPVTSVILPSFPLQSYFFIAKADH